MARKRMETQFGLALPEGAREKLRKAGIFVQTAVTVEHQHLADRFVMRGVESGGAVEGFGHYVTFAAEDGSPLPCLCRVESLAVNGPHALVVAPVLVRAEMLRVGHTFDLLITRHRPSVVTNGKKRPTLASDLLFRGRHGHLGEGGDGVPAFFTRGGEPLRAPQQFLRLVASLVQGSQCCGCEHSHGLVAPDNIATEPSADAENRSGLQVDEPNWRPLEQLLGPPCTQFMWMGRKGDVQFYKHILTRRYLRLDSSGRCYREGPQGLELASLEEELRRLVE
jgi:hypothetical protein